MEPGSEAEPAGEGWYEMAYETARHFRKEDDAVLAVVVLPALARSLVAMYQAVEIVQFLAGASSSFVGWVDVEV